MNLQLPLTAVIVAAAATFSVHAMMRSGKTGAFVCGGVGADARRELAQETRGANLALEFFVARRGNYVSGVHFSLTRLDGPAAGQSVEVTADGPLCFVKVAPGRYRVDADLDGVKRSARTTIPGEVSRPVRVAVAFPEAAVRGDLDIRPTPEEREEARTP